MAKQYRIVYDNVKPERTYITEFGSYGWLWDKDVAEKLLIKEQKRADSYGWIEKLYIEERETEQEDTRQAMRIHENGKSVYNWDHLIWKALNIGDYVEEEVADDILDALPPASMSSECLQLGEPEDHINGKATYLTLSRVDSSTWQFRGYCFRGQTTELGKEVAA